MNQSPKSGPILYREKDGSLTFDMHAPWNGETRKASYKLCRPDEAAKLESEWVRSGGDKAVSR